MEYKSGHIYLIDYEPTGSELANFTKPVQFDICQNGLFYSILYDKNGNRFVEDRSRIVTGFVKIGEVTQVGNQITIGVHPSGFNHWRINGVDITSTQVTILEINPVADGQFRTDWIFGNSAGGLFILQGVPGKFPIKPNPLNFPQFAFFQEIQITPDDLGGDITLNVSDVFTGDAIEVQLDVKEAGDTTRGTMSIDHWRKLDGINLLDYVQNSTLSSILSAYATNIALSSGLANRYQISTTNITAPDSTYLYALLTDSSGVVRRLNLATYLTANFVTPSSLTTTLAGYATSTDLTTGLNNRYVIATTSIASPDATYLYAVMSSASGVTRRLDLSTYLIANYAALSNLITAWGATSSNTKFPSEKLVKDAIQPQLYAAYATNTAITNATLIDSKPMNGRNLLLDVGANTLTFTINTFSEGNFCITGTKIGAGLITFVAGSGVTIVQADSLLSVNGATYSDFKLLQVGTTSTFILSIFNR